jgi:hypothetical protein
MKYFLLALLLPGLAHAETIGVVARSSTSDCMQLDNEFVGTWTVDGDRLSKGGQSWTLKEGKTEQVWAPYGLRAVVHVVLKDHRLSFSTAWGCRWQTP